MKYALFKNTDPNMSPLTKTSGRDPGKRVLQTAAAKSDQEQQDDSIMNTNDSSTVSKQSVTKLYYPNELDFYQPFVKRFRRRNPLINRGYWLRMQAIEIVVRKFLEEDTRKEKVVINLGCG